MHQITIFSMFCLLFFVGTVYSQDGTKNQPVMNSFYQRWMNSGIVSPFLKAYTTLNKNIIGKILSVKPNSKPNTIKSLINYLQCRFETIPKQLRRATMAGERIRKSFEHEEKLLLQKISNQEKRVHSKEQEVNNTKINLEHAENKMKLEEQAEQDNQRSVDAARREMERAEEEVKNSDNCRRRRRKKRFLSDVLCGMFGGKGTDNAHERLTMTAHNLHRAKHQSQFQKQIVKNQRFRYGTAVSQHNETIAQLHALESKLDQTRTAFKRVTTITAEFKKIETFITEISGASTAFKDQLIDLMDFEHVIDPLNDIYQQMIDNKLINVNTGKKSIEITQPTSEKLEKVKEIVKTWDVVIKDDDEMTTPCVLFDDD